jgi:hypothetical protein
MDDCDTQFIQNRGDFMPLPVNTLTRRAIKRVVKQKTGKEPMSSFAVGCLTGDLYDFYKSVTLLMTIKQASQQTFEDDLKRLVELLRCMKSAISGRRDIALAGLVSTVMHCTWCCCYH